MKNITPFIIFVLFVYSCSNRAVIKKSGTKLKINKVGVMDTLTVNVFGTVKDLKNKNVLERAEVRLSNNQNTYSQYCNKDGEFAFKHIQSGKYKILSTYIAHYWLEDSIEFKTGEIVELKIELGSDD